MAREQGIEEGARPLLKGLGHESVVGVSESMLGDAPGGVPLHGVLIDKQAHELGHGDGGMGVVHLDSEVAMQLGEGTVLIDLDLQDVLERAGDEEKLLGEAKL